MGRTASEVTINQIRSTVREDRGFDLIREDFTSEVVISKDDRTIEELIGPFRIATTDLRVILKVTAWFESDTVDAQFILIDCEGDVIHHNGQRIDGYGIDIDLGRISL